MAQMTLGLIIGNRNFFPAALTTEARRDLLALFEELNIRPVLLEETATKRGAVETWEDAQKCADLFKAHREQH